MPHFTITPEYLLSQGLSLNFPERFWSKVNKSGPVPAHRPELGPCWLWTASTSLDFYGHIHKDHQRAKGIMIYSHRAAWILLHGPIPEGLKVLHGCDNAKCCNADTHLFLGTVQDNIDDKCNKGRQARLRGEKCGRAKLSESQVKEILELALNTSLSLRAIGAKFGIPGCHISRIVSGEQWSHMLTGFTNEQKAKMRRQLTAAQVIEMRRLYENGQTQTSIGKQFGISNTNVCVIVNRKTWTHI